jgi:2-polyprenyl-3-methyl-5-hydroxy-6-metoxy-1,4-benzoquinol methylase
MFRSQCLICGNPNLKEIINLGMHPFADTFIPEKERYNADQIYPLICDMCPTCGQVQTRCITDPNERYSKIDYSYTSSNSKFSREHWEKYSQEINNKIKLKKDAFIVEIGSNDGFLAEQFKLLGFKILGVDPSQYMANLAKQRNVETVVDLFGAKCAEKIIKEYGKADLIIANNVFNHSNNPLEFAKAVASLLSDDGSFVFEQPYWPIGVKSEKFDQIYHEHVSYFTVKSASELLKRAGMEISSAEIVEYHGGSLRIIAKLGNNSSEEAKKFIEQETDEKMFDLKTYTKLMENITLRRNDFLQKVYKLKEKGLPIIAVGAAAKGNTFLNFYNLNNTIINYVTDSSQHKQGKYTPSTRIPIKGDEIFSKYKEVYALILSWNIANIIKEKLFKINPNIKFLVPE